MHGEGPALLCLPFGFSHAQHVWVASSASPMLNALAERFRVVYYDGRGQGLSQRGLKADTTISTLVQDLVAVLDAAQVERPVVFASGLFSHVAVRFAVESPRRVAALALMHCDVSFVEHVAGMVSLVKANWEYFLYVWAGFGVPSASGGVSSRRVEGLKERTTQEDFLRSLRAFEDSDITDALTRLKVPALVLHPSQQQWVNQEASARSAALIPNGRLAVLNSDAFFGNEDAAIAIESFLGEAGVTGQRPAAVALAHDLSARETEVLKLLAGGLSNQQIAENLVISLNTVTRHVSNIYAKTGLANRAQAAVYARDRGLT